MIAGVFILAFPTMILSGNFEAAARVATTQRSWEDVLEAVDTVADVEPPRAMVLRMLGWADPRKKKRRRATQEKDNSHPDGVSPGDGSMNRHAAGSTPLAKGTDSTDGFNLSTTGGGGVGASSVNENKSSSVLLDRSGNPITDTMPHLGPVVGMFNFRGVPRPIRRDLRTLHSFYYDPLFALALCDDGAPTCRVIPSTCGQPTMIQLTMILDDVDVRAQALQMVQLADPDGMLRCDLGGGFEVIHYHSLKEGKSLRCPEPFKLMSAVAAPGYRNSDFALCFQWTAGEELLSTLTDDDVGEMAISYLLGSTLHIKFYLPEALTMRRIPIVQQLIHHTTLHRELALIAGIPEFGGELTSYVTKYDASLMLRGVHKKIMIDPSLVIEDGNRVDEEILQAVLNRVRVMRYVGVPSHLRETAVYNFHMLTAQTMVYEFPLVIFNADERDLVDEDALGYVEARMRVKACRTLRVDIAVDYKAEDIVEDPTNEEVSSEEADGYDYRHEQPSSSVGSSGPPHKQQHVKSALLTTTDDGDTHDGDDDAEGAGPAEGYGEYAAEEDADDVPNEED